MRNFARFTGPLWLGGGVRHWIRGLHKLPIGRDESMPPVSGPSDPADPVPRGNGDAMEAQGMSNEGASSPRCSAQPGPQGSGLAWFGVLGVGSLVARRRRRARRG
jgi:MYXO-CTERM domain-containing protein